METFLRFSFLELEVELWWGWPGSQTGIYDKNSVFQLIVFDSVQSTTTDLRSATCNGMI